MLVPAPIRPTRADARRNYDRLVEAARLAFTQHGTDASLDDIAKSAGVGPGTLYRHFPTREALLEAVLYEAQQRLLTDTARLVTAAPPADALVGCMELIVRQAATYSGLAEALLATRDRPDSPLYSSCVDFTKAVGDLLARAQQAGGARDDVTADDLLAMCCGIAVAVEPTTPGFDQRLTTYLTVFADGLRSRPA